MKNLVFKKVCGLFFVIAIFVNYGYSLITINNSSSIQYLSGTYNDDIEITGKTYCMINNTTVRMAAGKRIDVKPGCYLYILNSTITSTTGDVTTPWEGIFVFGEANGVKIQKSFTWFKTAATLTFANIFVENSYFNNSKFGIVAGFWWSLHPAAHPGVFISNTEFNNNYNSTVFVGSPLANRKNTGKVRLLDGGNLYDPYLKNSKIYLSYTNAQLSSASIVANATCVFSAVADFNISDCLFQATNNADTKHRGIVLQNSASVSKVRMENIKEAILGSGYYYPAPVKVSIANCEFQNYNYDSYVFLEGLSNASVTKSSFRIPISTCLLCGFGLKIQQCSQSLVEGNTFNGSTSFNGNYPRAIVHNDNGTLTHSVNKNTFNSMGIAVQAANTNSNLNYYCNLFQNNQGYDIYVSTNDIAVTMNKNQGSPTAPARNIFTASPLPGHYGHIHLQKPITPDPWPGRWELNYYYGNTDPLENPISYDNWISKRVIKKPATGAPCTIKPKGLPNLIQDKEDIENLNTVHSPFSDLEEEKACMTDFFNAHRLETWDYLLDTGTQDQKDSFWAIELDNDYFLYHLKMEYWLAKDSIEAVDTLLMEIENNSNKKIADLRTYFKLLRSGYSCSFDSLWIENHYDSIVIFSNDSQFFYRRAMQNLANQLAYAYSIFTQSSDFDFPYPAETIGTDMDTFVEYCDMTCYPNPVVNQLNVKLKNYYHCNCDFKLVLRNKYGVKLSEQNITVNYGDEGTAPFDFSNYASDAYICQLLLNNNLLFSKWVIK